MSRFDALEVRLGGDALRLEEFEADFGEPAGGEVVVDYDAGRATIHVLGRREIADGSLSCSIDGMRRALVALDLDFLRRVLAEAPRAGGRGGPDADLDGMSHAALLAHAREMRAAIRAHRDASGHDLCWHHPELWGLLAGSAEGRAGGAGLAAVPPRVHTVPGVARPGARGGAADTEEYE